MRLVAWGQSEAGYNRQHNEDRFTCDPVLGMFAAADGTGRVMAADAQGLHLLTGAGSPVHYPFPSDEAFTPARLIMAESFVLVHTREGRVFHLAW